MRLSINDQLIYATRNECKIVDNRALLVYNIMDYMGEYGNAPESKKEKRKMQEISMVFPSYVQEEKWLRSLAKKGLMLADRTFMSYCFVENDGSETVSVVKFKNPVNNGESDAEIKNIEAEGQTYICGYRCWGYFRGKKAYASERRKENAVHYFNIALIWFTAFLFAIGTFSYQLNFFVFQKLGETGFYDKPKAVCIAFAVLSFMLAVPTIYYLTIATTCFLDSRTKKEEKKK